MSRFTRMLKSLVRSLLHALVVLTMVLGLFLGGYFLGWGTGGSNAAFVVAPETTVSAPREAKESADPVEGAVAGAEQLSTRLSRLAAWLVPSRHKRSSEARVAAEIADMLPAEIRDGLERLERAPNTEIVANLRSSLLLRWATDDPAAAFAYWQAHSDEVGWSRNVVGELLVRWAERDPLAAVRQWEAHSAQVPELERGFTLRQVFTYLARRDLAVAIAEARRIGGEYKAEALRGVAYLGGGPAQRTMILDSFVALPAGPERAAALATALQVWFDSGRDAGAIAWLDAAPLDAADYTKIQDELAGRWFNDDRQAAADWLVSRARSPVERARALERMTAQWMMYDLTAAGQWLVAQGLNADASRAMQVYADYLAASFPAEAMTWAGSIPDAQTRQKALDRVTKRIRELHPEDEG